MGEPSELTKLMIDNLPEGQLTPEQAYAIYEALDLIPPGVCLEIGAYFGRSTVLIANHPNVALLYSIDVWDHYRIPGNEYQHDESVFKQYCANLLKYNVQDKVRHVTGRSYDILGLCGKFFMAIFIDGDHQLEYIKQDLCFVAWLHHKGVLIIHDYDNSPGVREMTDRYITPYYKVCARADNIIAFHK